VTGETVWILAKLPGYIRVVGDDVSEKYLLLANRHDGGGAVRVQFTPIRVVCQNTLNIALTGAERSFRARHTGALGQRVKTVQDYLGIVDAKSALFEEAARKLATVQLTQEAWKNYAKASGLVPETPEGERPSSRAYQIIEDVSRLFERGKGQDLPGARGTAWGAFNAVVEYVDYVRSTRNDKRAESLLFGSGGANQASGLGQRPGLGAVKNIPRAPSGARGDGRGLYEKRNDIQSGDRPSRGVCPGYG
jgi:phage/plasmid-like protein (TIGR03299 family)